MKTTLPAKSEERKEIPLYSGYYAYFPAAIAGAAKVSMIGMRQHNLPKLGHNRSKSGDHPDCALRHIMDVSGLVAAYERGESVDPQQILTEVSYLVWRASAWSQVLHERFGGAPMAPAAFVPQEVSIPPPPSVEADPAHYVPAYLLRPQKQL